jgi:hypothetical protein
MNHSTHPVTREEVMALQDGELSGKQWEAVAGHVAFCHECNAFLKEMEETSRDLRSWRVGELREQAEQRVLEAAKELRPKKSQSDRKGQITGLPSGGTTRRWLLALGACAAAVYFALSVSSLRRGSPDPAAARRFNEQKLAMEAGKNIVALDGAVPEWPKKAPVAGGGGGNGEVPREEESWQADGAGRPALTAEEVRQGPMIAQSVELAVVAKDVSAARSAVEAILARHHGYAAGLTVNTEQNGPRSLEASLRIPARELLPAMAELKALGGVQTETQKGEEVTQQHADLVARLKNSRETEKRLQAILQQRTGKIADVLAVEQEIARVRGEIEQMEAEQKSVEHRVDFATVELHLSEEYKEQLGTGKLSTGRRLRNAAVSGLRDAYENLLGAIVFVMGAAPTLLLWVVVLFFPARWIWIKRQRWMWGTRRVATKA